MDIAPSTLLCPPYLPAAGLAEGTASAWGHLQLPAHHSLSTSLAFAVP